MFLCLNMASSLLNSQFQPFICFYLFPLPSPKQKLQDHLLCTSSESLYILHFITPATPPAPECPSGSIHQSIQERQTTTVSERLSFIRCLRLCIQIHLGVCLEI
ncbi:hypothetical protein XENOCAPTIV_019030 [Xenoophorus captivus]|uniref:Uncharacterized protein n=1 Tax=Xenoophorus captivus TaxID=1517983 RepID=A0ABV0S2H6_9TELE